MRRELETSFFFEQGTVIRLYGLVHQPYILPAFFTLIVFALELIRQKLILENQHFFNFNKSLEIIFPWGVVPFITKNKYALPIIEIKLREMWFPTEAAINYDPHHIISIRR